MKAPYRWLMDYVKTGLSPRELADKMVMTGNAVEGIEDMSAHCKNVVVGKIIGLEKHPNADKLQICSIDVGKDEPVQIVTGADNVFVGALVPAALHGSLLPNGVSIKKGKLRGVDSFGMLCSGEELALSATDYPGADVYGILILQEDWAPGTDMNEVLMTDDTVLDFEVGANRPDCLSILGLAREAGAAIGKIPHVPTPEAKPAGGDIKNLLDVEIKDKDLCPRYMAMMVQNVKIAPSPRWMQMRLKAAGVRPINNLVDITNFVMLETGQPMHAFDYDDIRGKKIIVRRAEDGERMTTLDGKERVFNPSMLLIADAEGPVGIAGVMGGENSGIKDTTTSVVFESAKFMYGSIRQTSRALGLSTEASMRFSKGIDAVNCDYAIRRACQLVTELKAGDIVGGSIDVLSEDISERMIEVTPGEINALLGTELTSDKMVECLERVLIWTERKGGRILCYIPHFRGDIDGKADIAEEIARIYGYDNIPVNEPVGRMMRMGDPRPAARDLLKYYLVGQGYDECITYSFTGTAVWDKLRLPGDDPMRNAIRIKNPLGDDSGYMRTTLTGDMLTVLATNLKRKNKRLRLFEMSKIYRPTEAGKLPDEHQMLCLGGSGDMDFFTLKGMIENLLEAARVDGGAEYVPGGGSYLHPGRSAKIYVNGKYLGELGEVHPDVADSYDIPGRAYVAELNIDTLLGLVRENLRFRLLPKFPAVERDIALTVGEDAPAGGIAAFITAHGGKYIESAELFDVYQGANIGEGKKSLAYSLRFRSKDGTLTDADIDMEKLLDELKREFGATLRD